MTTGPDYDNGGGETAGENPRSTTARRAAITEVFMPFRGQTDMPPEYLDRAVERMVTWLDTPVTNDIELVDRGEEATDLAREVETAYPGEQAWDTLRVMLATDLLNLGHVPAAGDVIALAPTVDRAIDAVVAVTAAFASKGRRDMQELVGLLYVGVYESLGTTDPAAAAAYFDQLQTMVGRIPGVGFDPRNN